MAVPAATGMGFTTLCNVADMYFAGWISTDAWAGLAISFQVLFMLVSIGFGANCPAQFAHSSRIRRLSAAASAPRRANLESIVAQPRAACRGFANSESLPELEENFLKNCVKCRTCIALGPAHARF